MAYLFYGERILSGLVGFQLTVRLGRFKYRFMSEARALTNLIGNGVAP
jgi:hypothetical protein